MPRGVPNKKKPALPDPVVSPEVNLSATKTGRISVTEENRSNLPREDTSDVAHGESEVVENLVEVTVVHGLDKVETEYRTEGPQGSVAVVTPPVATPGDDVGVSADSEKIPFNPVPTESSSPRPDGATRKEAGSEVGTGDLKNIDVSNYFNVRAYGKTEIIVLRQQVGRMSFAEAMAFAAHLVNIADPAGQEFPLYLKKLRGW